MVVCPGREKQGNGSVLTGGWPFFCVGSPVKAVPAQRIKLTGLRRMLGYGCPMLHAVALSVCVVVLTLYPAGSLILGRLRGGTAVNVSSSSAETDLKKSVVKDVVK